MADNDDDHMMQVVRMTIDGKTYTMFSPPIVAEDEDIGAIEGLEFGEWIPIKHVVSSLIHHLNNTIH
jgi:hypothetical protein